MTTQQDLLKEMQETARSAFDQLNVRRVFGEPIEREGLTVIPVATIAGGGGGGGGGDNIGNGGSGGAFGFGATPVGAYVIKNGEVSWRPVIDANRLLATAAKVVTPLLVAIGVRGKLRSKKKANR